MSVERLNRREHLFASSGQPPLECVKNFWLQTLPKSFAGSCLIMSNEFTLSDDTSCQQGSSKNTESFAKMNLKEKFLTSVRGKSWHLQHGSDFVAEKTATPKKVEPEIEETFYASDMDKKHLLIPLKTDGSLPGDNNSNKNSILKTANSLYSLTSQSSEIQCRICHSNVNIADNPLISPCRCKGTLKFVHTTCLVRWLEISSDKFWPTKRCELCTYKFKRHSIWELRKLQWPAVSTEDRVLNIVFVCLLLMMITCIVIAFYFPVAAKDSKFSSDHYVRFGTAFFRRDEITTVIAGVFFLISFLLALCTQYRAGGTVFRLLFRVWAINRNWLIRDYEPENDLELQPSPTTLSDTTVIQLLIETPTP